MKNVAISGKYTKYFIVVEKCKNENGRSENSCFWVYECWGISAAISVFSFSFHSHK
jgi:hypothetical protein